MKPFFCLFKQVKLLARIPAKIHRISVKEGPKSLQNYDNSNKAAHTEQSVLLNG